MRNDDKIVHIDTARTDNYSAAADRDQNVIGARIAEVRHSRGLSLSAFSKLLSDCGLEITLGAISKWETGVSIPSAYQLVATCKVLNIDYNFSYFTSRPTNLLLNDEGMKKLSEYRTDLIATGHYAPRNYTTVDSIDYVTKPVSNLRASAGTGAFLDEGNFEMVSFPANAVPAGATFGLRISGDSMEPVYSDGQLVWVHECDELQAGDIGIFMYDGNGYIKSYAERKPDDSEADAYVDSYGVMHMQPVLISYNKKYDPIFVSPNADFCIAGRVL